MVHGARITSVTFDEILRTHYLPPVKAMLNQQSVFLNALSGSQHVRIVQLNGGASFRRLARPIQSLSWDEAVGRLMAAPYSHFLPTLDTVLTEFFAPVVRNHRLKVSPVHQVMDRDALSLTASCEDCYRTWAQHVSNVAVVKQRDVIENFLRDSIRPFFEHIEKHECVDGPWTRAEVAEWLTLTLEVMQALDLDGAERLWKQQGEDWPRPMVESVAHGLGFVETAESLTGVMSVDELLTTPPPLDLKPLQTPLAPKGWLRLPKGHPKRKAA